MVSCGYCRHAGIHAKAIAAVRRVYYRHKHDVGIMRRNSRSR